MREVPLYVTFCYRGGAVCAMHFVRDAKILARSRRCQKASTSPCDARSRKEAWPFYRTISGVRLCWELKEPKGPKGSRTGPQCQQELFEEDQILPEWLKRPLGIEKAQTGLLRRASGNCQTGVPRS